MQTLGAGITTVVMEKFDAEGCLDAIQRHRVTHGQFVPAMFVRMLKLPEDIRNSYDLSSLKRAMAGEIYFQGGSDFEYLNDPEKTAKSRDKHGWTTVGDIGYLDEEGYRYLTDRRHHLIISGGVNIYPQEAENILVTHPKVMDAAVFGVPDGEMGQTVKGVVQTIDPADASDEFGEELLGWLRERLAHYKCPRSISFETRLPRADTGKMYKQELINRYS